jgi:hypothetical protein
MLCKTELLTLDSSKHNRMQTNNKSRANKCLQRLIDSEVNSEFKDARRFNSQSLNNNNSNNNSIQLYILCATSTAKRPITDTAQI